MSCRSVTISDRAAWLTGLAASIALVVGWWVPSSPMCAALGWTSVVLWFVTLQCPTHRMRRAFILGSLTYAGGFYWLLETISEFGGFPWIAALAVFLLFVCGSAIQFLVLAFAWTHIPKVLARLGLRTACAWLIAQHFWIRIFPWDFGHTQIAFAPLAQIADIGGVWLITALMMWVSECLVGRSTVALGARVSALATLIASVGYGSWMISTFEKHVGPSLNTVLVQGNVSMQQKHNIKYFTVNRERYLKISREVSQPDTLIIWPESTITDGVPLELENARFSKLLPFIGDGSAFLVGAITFRRDRSLYNSSVLIRPDGTIPPPYNKIVLMPFGEYTPFANFFPFLKEINSTAGEFSSGLQPEVLSFPLSTGIEVKVAPLICYEDVTPSLAQQAVSRGAELLVNQTNDAWFGDSVAPAQHTMIASFRAIENRRYLLRSTNTGLTGIIDPFGTILATLPTFSEGTITMPVNLIRYRSLYSALPIEELWFALSVLLVGFVLRGAWSSRRGTAERGVKHTN